MEFILFMLGVFAFFVLIGMIGTGDVPGPAPYKKMFDTKEDYENFKKLYFGS